LGGSSVVGWRAEDLVGGHIVLDFLNTTGGRGKARDGERLTEYADLLGWGAAATLLRADEAAALATALESRPEAAAAELGRTTEWREALHSVLVAVQAHAPLPETARETVEAVIQEAQSDARLGPGGAGLAWQADPAEPLALPLTRLGLAASAFLTGPDLTRLRTCERCTWMFVDRGRGRARRWCSMSLCGNRAKAARHYARTRQKG
jgi:predicted RNA-binding Zn ribbon-like protein